MVVMMLSKSPFAFFAPLFMKKHRRVRPALPMGVAPEAIVEKTYFEYRLKYIAPTFTHQVVALFDNIIGCTLSAPDGSSPRGYSRIFSGIDLKNDLFFLGSSIPFMSFFFDFLGHHQYVDMSYHTFAEFSPISVHHLSYSDFLLLEFL
jgi:hypothetical protein